MPSDEALEILENECVALAEELKKTLIEKTEVIEQRTASEATPTNIALQVSVQVDPKQKHMFQQVFD